MTANHKHAWLANLALTLGSSLVAVLAVEVFLRINDASTEAVPSERVRMNGHDYVMRHSRHDLQTSANAVVVIGDSFVAGEKCGRDNNVTGHLSKMLPDPVINLGEPGTGIFSYQQRLQDYTAEFGKPQKVIALIYANDIVMEPVTCAFRQQIFDQIELGPSAEDRITNYCTPYTDNSIAELLNRKRENMGGSANEWLRQSYVYRLVREIAAQVMLRTGLSRSIGRAAYPELWGDPESAEFEIAQLGLKMLVDSAIDSGAQPMIAFYPNVENLTATSPMYRAYSEAIPNLESSLGHPVYSGYGAFLNNSEASEKMVWSLTDAHPSCKAHEIMAEWLFGMLQPVE